MVRGVICFVLNRKGGVETSDWGLLDEDDECFWMRMVRSLC